MCYLIIAIPLIYVIIACCSMSYKGKTYKGKIFIDDGPEWFPSESAERLPMVYRYCSLEHSTSSLVYKYKDKYYYTLSFQNAREISKKKLIKNLVFYRQNKALQYFDLKDYQL